VIVNEADICREIQGLKETGKDGLFIVEKYDKEDEVVFFDVRSSSVDLYGYEKSIEKEKTQLSENELRPIPNCVKEAKSKIKAENNQTLSDFQ